MAGKGGGYQGSHFGVDSREKKAVEIVSEGPKLDSAWSFDAQFRVLNNVNKVEDWSFVETSVKDVTDRGRSAAASRLQLSLEEALQAIPVKPSTALSSSGAGGSSSSTAAQPAVGISVHAPLENLEMSEQDVRNEVKILVKHLKTLRDSSKGPVRDTSALDVLRQLQALPVSVACLKSTKVAVELNEGCWRGKDVSPQVRELASTLVHRWRAMFREGSGGGAETIKPAGAGHKRRCRNVSMDLEEACYGNGQRKLGYSEMVECVCYLIRTDPERSRSLMTGAERSKDIVTKAEHMIKRRRLAAKHGTGQTPEKEKRENGQAKGQATGKPAIQAAGQATPRQLAITLPK